jgi:glutathione S-transferase
MPAAHREVEGEGMADRYRIFGAELSPYSCKVRAWFRYKGVAHDWLPRTPENDGEFQRLAKVPLVPLVVTPDGAVLQDSTPILDALEPRHPGPAVHPGDPVARAASMILEEYGDEWGNKWMFHYRWTREADQLSAAERIAMGRGVGAAQLAEATKQVRARMVPRLSFVGSSPETAPLIEMSFRDAIARVEAHLQGRDYLFGGRPAFGDFGLAAQLHQCATDPTPGAILRERAPKTYAWAMRMQEPKASGGFEPWSALAPTLLPLFREEVAGRFLPWTCANVEALKSGAPGFAVQLGADTFAQAPQKYHARSFEMLRERLAPVVGKPEVRRFLDESGCAAWIG